MASLFHRFSRLDFKIAHADEPWEYTEEPHASRRQEILKKHPEIKKLMGPEPLIAYAVVLKVILQLGMVWILQDASWGAIFLFAYVISGTLNHSLGSAIHEIGHNLAFGHSKPLWNRALGMIANLPMAIPLSVTYKRYHSDHHRYLGHDSWDVDVPTVIETILFRNPLTKSVWLFMHPLLHGLRPFFKSPKVISGLEIINFITQISFDIIIFKVFGLKATVYLLMGTLFGLGFHPLAGHFISEHYLYNKGQATHSYYGPLNPIVYNVGYHNEHHDFPYIPCTRLPEVRRIAPEYYDNIPYHTSWLKVLWDFIFKAELGPIAHGVGQVLKEDKPHVGQNGIANGHTVTANGNSKRVANGVGHSHEG